METHKKIVVVGYPKSGTTWLTRLTAELAGCPVEGFWGQPWHDEPAIEGHDRTSDFRCYKAHHPAGELREATEKSIYKLLYIVRDPRDVIVSGGQYFDPPRFEWFETYVVQKVLRRIPGLKERYERSVRPRSYRTRRMMGAVLHGDPDFGWCQVSWAEHVNQYVNTEALLLRYEDLLEDPHAESRRILNHLGLDRSDEHIREAVWEQSMEKKRQELQRQGEEKKLSVMNKGGERWRDEMSHAQRRKIENELRDAMRAMGYTPE